MKHTLYISSILAACMLLFSCASDNTAVSENGTPEHASVNISLSTGIGSSGAKSATRSTGVLPTDNGGTVGTNEGTLNHICVGLFDTNNKLVTLYEYDYSGDQNVPTRTDAVKMLVFANVPVGAFAGKYTVSDFYTAAQDLGYTTSVDGKSKGSVTSFNSQSMNSLPMMSAVTTLDWTHAVNLKLTSSVELTRQVARVALTNITYNFTGSYNGCTFVPKEIFMYNANNSLTNWDTKSVSGSVSGENIPANANTAYMGSGTISSFSSGSPYYFYVFPNSSTTAPTKLVIKGTFTTKSGTTYTTYYPITVNSSATGNIISTVTGGTGDSKITGNTTYGLAVTISGTGVNSVSDELTATNVTVTTSVDSYTNATIAEHFGPAVGDIYYSDGTYSNNYYAGKTPIGIIVSTNPVYCEAAKGYGHGLVMALTNANGGSGVAWCSSSAKGYTGVSTTYSTTVALCKSDVSGLSRTNSVKNMSDYSTNTSTNYPSFYSLTNYSVSAPAITSGWFLPSIGQWYETIQNAQIYYNSNSGTTYSIPYSTASGSLTYDFGSSSYAQQCATAVDYLVEKGSSSFPTHTSLRQSSSANYFYWSSSECSSSVATSLNLDVSGSLFLHGPDKKITSNQYVRPFLAF